VSRGLWKRKVWTTETIVAAIQEWAAVNGDAPRSWEWARSGAYHPSNKTVEGHFGYWSDAIVAAGFVSRPGRPRGT